ncbi:MAG: hypothetical protein WA842_00940 [Croceibacterium sp.]
MIDTLTLALTHGLMALALWRLLFRPDLDEDGAERPVKRQPWRRATPAAKDRADA